MTALLSVPVLLGFDYKQVIGTLSIDSSKLPPEPNFAFAIGYLSLERNKDGSEGMYQLLNVGLVGDHLLATEQGAKLQKARNALIDIALSETLNGKACKELALQAYNDTAIDPARRTSATRTAEGSSPR